VEVLIAGVIMMISLANGALGESYFQQFVRYPVWQSLKAARQYMDTTLIQIAGGAIMFWVVALLHSLLTLLVIMIPTTYSESRLFTSDPNTFLCCASARAGFLCAHMARFQFRLRSALYHLTHCRP
jgi:hypothetical protein